MWRNEIIFRAVLLLMLSFTSVNAQCGYTALDGRTYDFTSLILPSGQNYSTFLGTSSCEIGLNVCGNISANNYCGVSNASLCMACGSAYYGEGPALFTEDASGTVIMQYWTPQCNQWSRVYMTCDPTVNTPVLSYVGEDHGCALVLNLTSAANCPAALRQPPACELQWNGFTLNFTTLADQVFTASDGTWTYSISLCSSLSNATTTPCGYGAGVCLYLPSTGDYNAAGLMPGDWTVGQWTGLTQYGGITGPAVQFQNGDYCAGYGLRTTIVNLVCDWQATTPVLEFVSQNPVCTYLLTLKTKEACIRPNNCSFVNQALQTVDLSEFAVAGTYGFVATPPGFASLPILANICTRSSQCPPGEGVCALDSFLYLEDIGDLPGELGQDLDGVYIHYNGYVDSAHTWPFPWQSTISFVCDEAESVNTMSLVQFNDQDWHFQLTTDSATICDVVPASCKFMSPNGLYDLTGLIRTDTPYNCTNNQTFVINVCAPAGNPPVCGGVSAACFTSDGTWTTSLGSASGVFGMTPGGLLYLWYQNSLLGPTCGSNLSFVCDNSASEAWVMLNSTDGCIYSFTMYTNVVCQTVIETTQAVTTIAVTTAQTTSVQTTGAQTTSVQTTGALTTEAVTTAALTTQSASTGQAPTTSATTAAGTAASTGSPPATTAEAEATTMSEAQTTGSTTSLASTGEAQSTGEASTGNVNITGSVNSTGNVNITGSTTAAVTTGGAANTNGPTGSPLSDARSIVANWLAIVMALAGTLWATN